MKSRKINDALQSVSDRHLAEAAAAKGRRRYGPWICAVAAALALVITISAIGLPGTPSAPSVSGTPTAPPDPSSPSIHTPPVSNVPPTDNSQLAGAWKTGLLSAPVYPTMVQYPQTQNGLQYDEAAYEAWKTGQKEQYDQPAGYADGLEDFFTRLIGLALENQGENAAVSPINVYLALAMLAETAGGETRQQILDTLGADSLTHLRTQADHVWNAHYRDDGTGVSILANSLWLDDDFLFRSDTVSTLSQQYYASVYQGELGSQEMTDALRSWLNEQTGGLLKEQVNGISMDDETMLALASTINYQMGWQVYFNKNNNTQEIFHSPAGDTVCTFMNMKHGLGTYYYGDDYGAVAISMEDGGTMWLVLPDEGLTPADILESGKALNMILQEQDVNTASLYVNLSLPKFDIADDNELSDALKSMGITDAFEKYDADFSSIVYNPAYAHVSSIKHAVRVAIDEEGAAAVAYTVIALYGATSAPPLELEEIDFVLDRPFLFVIESADGLPMFCGIVNEP